MLHHPDNQAHQHGCLRSTAATACIWVYQACTHLTAIAPFCKQNRSIQRSCPVKRDHGGTMIIRQRPPMQGVSMGSSKAELLNGNAEARRCGCTSERQPAAAVIRQASNWQQWQGRLSPAKGDSPRHELPQEAAWPWQPPTVAVHCGRKITVRLCCRLLWPLLLLLTSSAPACMRIGTS